MSHLLKHLGLWEERPTYLPHWPEAEEPRGITVNRRLIREFAAYYRAHGNDWAGLRFDGMPSEPMDSEAARLAGILEQLDQRRRWRVCNEARREVMR